MVRGQKNYVRSLEILSHFISNFPVFKISNNVLYPDTPCNPWASH